MGDLDLEDMKYLEYLYMYGDISGSPRRRKLLAKALVVSAVFVGCIALLLMSLLASGLFETSEQRQIPMAALQDDLGPAGPLDAQAANDPPPTSSSQFLAFTGVPECYGAWCPLFAALNEAFNARARP